MAAVIRIRLVDLLQILCETSPKEVRAKPNSPRQARSAVVEAVPRKDSGRQAGRIDEAELAAISRYLQCAGPAKRIDLQFALNLSEKAVLHRLDLLKERGVIEDLPGHRYGLAGD